MNSCTVWYPHQGDVNIFCASEIDTIERHHLKMLLHKNLNFRIQNNPPKKLGNNENLTNTQTI